MPIGWMVCGVVAVVYFQSMLTAVLVEGAIVKALKNEDHGQEDRWHVGPYRCCRSRASMTPPINHPALERPLCGATSVALAA